MARLQDYQTVTPSGSDKLLIVQSQGQGLATLDNVVGVKMDKANPTGTGSLSLNRKSGSTVGTNSVAEGTETIAQRKSQLVFGEYNQADTGGSGATSRGTYVEIVGKGTADNARSNARTLDWSGNEVLAGGLKINGNQDVLSGATTVSDSGSVSNTTTFSYTGKSVTIPANKVYVITANCFFTNAVPVAIGIVNSPTSQYGVLSSGVYGAITASCTCCGKTGNSPQTFYLWAKYESASNNNCNISGVYFG